MRNRFALLACLAAAAPALASAQTAGTIVFTESSTLSDGGLDDKVINIAECEGTASDSITLAWTYGSTPSSSKFYRIFAQTTADCPTTFSPSGTVKYITGDQSPATGISSTGNWTPAINVRTDLIEPLGLANSCSASGGTIHICVVVAATNGASSTVETTYTAKGSIVINATKPAAPTSVSARSGDGALTVSWTDGSPAASSFVVTAAPDPAPPGGANCTVTAPVTVTQNCSSSGCRVSNLTNDACYSVTVQGFSAVNNPSPVSAAVTGIPRAVDDFWETYQRAEGVEEGGCSGGPASALALLVLATAAPRLRRRRP